MRNHREVVRSIVALEDADAKRIVQSAASSERQPAQGPVFLTRHVVCCTEQIVLCNGNRDRLARFVHRTVKRKSEIQPQGRIRHLSAGGEIIWMIGHDIGYRVQRQYLWLNIVNSNSNRQNDNRSNYRSHYRLSPVL